MPNPRTLSVVLLGLTAASCGGTESPADGERMVLSEVYALPLAGAARGPMSASAAVLGPDGSAYLMDPVRGGIHRVFPGDSRRDFAALVPADGRSFPTELTWSDSGSLLACTIQDADCIELDSSLSVESTRRIGEGLGRRWSLTREGGGFLVVSNTADGRLHRLSPSGALLGSFLSPAPIPEPSDSLALGFGRGYVVVIDSTPVFAPVVPPEVRKLDGSLLWSAGEDIDLEEFRVRSDTMGSDDRTLALFPRTTGLVSDGFSAWLSVYHPRQDRTRLVVISGAGDVVLQADIPFYMRLMAGSAGFLIAERRIDTEEVVVYAIDS